MASIDNISPSVAVQIVRLASQVETGVKELTTKSSGLSDRTHCVFKRAGKPGSLSDFIHDLKKFTDHVFACKTSKTALSYTSSEVKGFMKTFSYRVQNLDPKASEAMKRAYLKYALEPKLGARFNDKELDKIVKTCFTKEWSKTAKTTFKVTGAIAAIMALGATLFYGGPIAIEAATPYAIVAKDSAVVAKDWCLNQGSYALGVAKDKVLTPSLNLWETVSNYAVNVGKGMFSVIRDGGPPAGIIGSSVCVCPPDGYTLIPIKPKPTL